MNEFSYIHRSLCLFGFPGNLMSDKESSITDINNYEEQEQQEEGDEVSSNFKLNNDNYLKTNNIHKHIRTGKPVYLRCPHCQELTLTRVKRRPGLKSLLGCLAVGLVAWCGCCLVPCFSRKWQDSIHNCPHCKRVITVVESKFRL